MNNESETPVMFPSAGVSEGLIRLSAVGELPALFASTAGYRDVRTAVLHKLKDLVHSAGDRLRACENPKCREPFIKVHKQWFCTKDCAQRYRDDKKRG